MHIDGGARGNPGPAGAGVVIKDDSGKRLHEVGYFLGRHTNNAAEYQALILGLKRAVRLADPHVLVYSDSELLVHQITGRYRVKSPNLIGYVEQAQSLLLKFESWSIHHVRREQNRRADQLANMAMDRSADAVEFDVDGETSRAPSVTPATIGDSAPAAELVGCDHAVRVVVATPPRPQHCPAAKQMLKEWHLQSALPSGMCLHAAHSLLQTVLAMNNTGLKEFAALPTVTVRCIKPKCGAAFQLSPMKSTNGEPRMQASD